LAVRAGVGRLRVASDPRLIRGARNRFCQALQQRARPGQARGLPGQELLTAEMPGTG
jgi:hypothetical protein